MGHHPGGNTKPCGQDLPNNKIKANHDSGVTPELINIILLKYNNGKLSKETWLHRDIDNYHKSRNQSQKTVSKAKRRLIIKEDQQWEGKLTQIQGKCKNTTIKCTK